MDTVKLEIYHGGEFKTKEGIYYYKGGTCATIYGVDVSDLLLERFLAYLDDVGYGTGLKIYYKKPLTISKEAYKLLWNFDSIKEMRLDAIKYGVVSIYADHCAEEKKKDVNFSAEHDLNEVDDGDELDDPATEKDDDSEDSTDEEILSGDDYDVESDFDEELEEIREKKRMLRDGKIDPLRDGSLSEMHINNGSNNVTAEQVVEEPHERHERQETERTAEDDDFFWEMPEWRNLVQHEYDMLAKFFPKFDDNQELGCEKVDKNFEEKEDSDSFDVPSRQSTDSSDYEEVDNIGVKKKKSKKKHVRQYPTFNPNTPIEHIEFEAGMIFTSREHLRDAIRNYGVAKQRRVYLKRSDFKRMQAKCRDGCKWEFWASRMPDDEAFQIKTYKRGHNCIIVSKQRMVKADWLAKQFGSTLRSNPRWKLKEFAEAITAKFKIQCTLNQCWWAKKIAMSELESVLKEHYGRLWDYGVEVLRTNPGSSVFIKGEVNEECENPTFQRMYICFGALKKGFLSGCRKISCSGRKISVFIVPSLR